jgi:UDP-glucose 4-epimerase
MAKKYLVTGGAGFIGSHLSRALIERGDKVVILDSLESGKVSNIADLLESENLEFIEDSILHESRLISICSGIDGIFHLAALVSVQRSIDDPELNHRINVDGFFSVLEVARKSRINKMVLASSAALYGNSYSPPHYESLQAVPLSPYAVGKYTSEVYSSVYSALYGVNVVCLRFFNVYGPNQDPSSPYSGVISKFMEEVSTGKDIIIFGDGEQTRDFVYVLDVVQALLLSMDSNLFGVFNVGTGIPTTINHLSHQIIKTSGSKVKVIHREQREGEVRYSYADISKARSELGFNPEYTLEKGLLNTYSWWNRS